MDTTSARVTLHPFSSFFPMPFLYNGARAPAFSLLNQHGVRLTLAEFRGHYLVLWWYPKADTPG